MLVWMVSPSMSQGDPDPGRFLNEIESFRAWDRKNAIPDDPVILVGSSTIRLWPTAVSFPELPVVNRGFGGAQISDLLHYRQDILLKYKPPSCILFYCGDNDVMGGKSAEQVVDHFRQFWTAVHDKFPNTPLVFIPIKPSPSRWHLWKEQSKANQAVHTLCEENPLLYYADTVTPLLNTGSPPVDSLFVTDRLHLSDKGYALWAPVVRPLIDKARRSHAESRLVLYEELTPTRFRKRLAEAPIAYLPLGTLEWHGEHLPLGSDGLQSGHFFELLAREAGGIVLPMLFLGPDRAKTVGGRELYGMDLGSMHWEKEHLYPDQQLDGSAYWVPDSTFKGILEAIWKQLSRAGFKVVVAHGHGPSTGTVRDHAREWESRYGLKFFNCWGYRDAEGLGIQVDHAGLNETSLVMALRPELVHLEYLSPDTAQWPVGVGSKKDPRIHASSDWGWQAITIQKERMARILREALAK